MRVRQACALALTTLLVGGGLATALPDASQAAKRPGVKLPSSKGKRWKLTHRSEFSSPAKSLATWQTQRDDWIKGGIPYSNLEGAPYRPGNVSVFGGKLRIAVGPGERGGPSLTTGSVNARSRMSYRYGYLEARILVPACSGCWPAFWLLARNDVWPPEINVFEFADTSFRKHPYSAVHWPSPNPALKEEYTSKLLSRSYDDNYTARWHRYGLLWDSKRVRVYLNGRLGATFKQRGTIPRRKMYPIMQLAVGQGFAPPVGSTMLVDYVRLWQQRR